MKLNLPLTALFLLVLVASPSLALTGQKKSLYRAHSLARNTSAVRDKRLWNHAIQKNPNDAEAYHQLGRILEAENRWDDAIAAYREAIDLSGKMNSARASKSLGDALVKQDRLEEATATFQHGIEAENPNASPAEVESSAYLRLGLALEVDNRDEEAADAYRRAIDLNPEDNSLSDFLGEIMVKQERLSKALEVYYQNYRDISTAYYRLGNALVRHNQLEAARDAYLKSLEDRRTDEISPEAIAYSELGFALEVENRLEDANTAYRRAIETDPKIGRFYGLYESLGRVLAKQHRLEDAFVAFGGSPENPRQQRNGMAYTLLGQTLLANHQFDEALKVCSKAIDLDFRNQEAHSCLARGAFNQNRLNEAIYAYQKAIEYSPIIGHTAYEHYELGNALQKQERLNEAIAAYQQALAIAPGDSRYSDALGNALAQQNRFDAAFEVYLKTARDDSEAYEKLGFILVRQKRTEEAIKACRQAIALRADNSEAYDCLGNAFLKANKPAEAGEAYQRAIALIPNFASQYGRSGNALIRQGSLEKTIRLYRRNPDWLPQSELYFSLYVRLGNALMAENRIEEAIASYNKAIASYPLQAQAYQRLGIAFLEQNKLGGALAAFRDALALDPNLPESLSYVDWIEGQLSSGDSVR